MGALWALFVGALGRSWALLGALGRSWALLGLDVADDWYMLAIGQRPDGNASDSD